MPGHLSRIILDLFWYINRTCSTLKQCELDPENIYQEMYFISILSFDIYFNTYFTNVWVNALEN